MFLSYAIFPNLQTMEIALVTGGKVVVASIIELDLAKEGEMYKFSYREQIAVLNQLMEEAENDLEILKDSIDIAYDHVSFLVEVGPVRAMMLKIIREEKIDFVVTAASIDGQLRDCHYGLNFEDILFSVPVPVLILHCPLNLSDIKTITLVLSNSMDLTSKVLDIFDAKLHIV